MTCLGTVRGVRPVQSNRLWNVRQLPGGRAKGHKGTKPRDWRQRPRAMGDRAEEVCELAGDPAPTTVLQFFMGNIQRSQWLRKIGGPTGKDDGRHHEAALRGVGGRIMTVE